jgi:hypothetical protein
MAQRCESKISHQVFRFKAEYTDLMGSFAHENKQQNFLPIPDLGQYEIWQAIKGTSHRRSHDPVTNIPNHAKGDVNHSSSGTFVNDTNSSRLFVDACQIGMGNR